MDERFKETTVLIGWIAPSYPNSDGITSPRGQIRFVRFPYDDAKCLFFYDRDVAQSSSLLKFLKNNKRTGLIAFNYITVTRETVKESINTICMVKEVAPDALLSNIDRWQYQVPLVRIELEKILKKALLAPDIKKDMGSTVFKMKAMTDKTIWDKLSEKEKVEVIIESTNNTYYLDEVKDAVLYLHEPESDLIQALACYVRYNLDGVDKRTQNFKNAHRMFIEAISKRSMNDPSIKVLFRSCGSKYCDARNDKDILACTGEKTKCPFCPGVTLYNTLRTDHFKQTRLRKEPQNFVDVVENLGLNYFEDITGVEGLDETQYVSLLSKKIATRR